MVAPVSVIICTRNRPDKIGSAVESVLANRYDGFDVTVVDQSTTEDTQKVLEGIASRHERLHLVRDLSAGLSRAYNIGIRASEGEIIAFTDDDCLVPQGWIASIVAAFTEDPEADLLYGQVIPASAEGQPEIADLTPSLAIDRPARLSRRDGFRVFGMGANFAARRRLFARIGMFDEVLGGGGPLKSSQDFDLAYRAYRAGAVIVLRPEVSLLHDGHRDLDDWPALLTNYGVGDGGFYAKHVRCGDLKALQLLVTRMVRKSMKLVVWTALGRKPEEGFYLRGVVRGIRDGFHYRVDRQERLYRTPLPSAQQAA